ncbi:MAG: CoA transferase [Candidatus Rokubacteria bacterium]|nr:CoA transferase [Candidatus Rokubacteria bacterium]
MSTHGNADYFEWTRQLFDRAQVFDKPEALRGIRVLELTTLVLGPSTVDFLGEYGAEVIKVELPPGGDTMRYVTPEGTFWRNASLGFFPENHSKYHVGIDLHSDDGKALFIQLAAKSDIMIENFRAGTLDAWGIGYRQIREVNPRIIYVADSGFGQWGPFAQGRPSYDAVAQTVSGMIGITGFPGRPPLLCGIFIGDWFGGLMGSMGALVALQHRQRTGEGQFVDFAQSEGLIRTLDWTWVRAGLTGRERDPAGNRDEAIGVGDIFPCRDGYVAVAAGRDTEFCGLCEAMGEPGLAQDPRYRTLEARQKPENARALLDRVRAWGGKLARAEVEAAAARFGFAAARVVNSKDKYEDDHLRARGSVWEYDDPLYGRMVEQGPGPKLSATPARIKWAGKPVGWHNEEIFVRLLGLAPSRIKELQERKVIGEWADRPGAKPPAEWTPTQGRV